MIDTQALRMKILDAAIRGKLTMQLPEDGNAEDLCNEIQNEKQCLIKEGKIKKEKPLPPITEDEIPFEIPENWKWCRLQDVAIKITDGTHHSPPNDPAGDYMYVSAKNIKDSGISLENMTYVTKDVHEEIYSRCNPEFGDVLLIKDGATAGVVTVNNIKEPFSMLSSVALIKVDSGFVDAWYLAYSLRSDLLYSIVREIMKGTGIPRITLKQIYPLYIPLPPLAEQKRIVSKIDAIFSQLDQIDKEQKKLADNSIALRNRLLEHGIRGKLTSHLASDGDAEMLYADIQKEKQRLIKEGKIKKEKPLPEIAENDIPFDIPENWKWVRLGEIFSVYGGKRVPVGKKWVDYDTGHKYIRVTDMKDGTISSSDTKYITEDVFQQIKKYTISKDDVYITVAGTIGRVGLVPDEFDKANLTENADKICIYKSDKYFVYYLLSSQEIQSQILEMVTQVGQPKLAILRIQNLILPLPPLVEQMRIVEKLNQLLPLCDALKADISGDEAV